MLKKTNSRIFPTAKVLGMGNALVDIMVQLENDSILKNFSLPKGSMQLVDNNFIIKISDNTSGLKKQQSSGGSAANTIHGLANLGIKTGFLGKVGNDDFGKFFSNDLENNNIKPSLLIGKSETGRAKGLVSPDFERTFATFLGAAIELNANDLSLEIFKEYDYLHIEGYLVQNHELLKKAVLLAKKNNLIISLDLASYNVVEENLEFLKSVISEYVDIVFANEEEAKAFTGKEPKDALNEIAKICEIAIVKIGENGSLIKHKNKIYEIGILNAKCIDTTGAGDLYAAGFLYGLINNFSIEKCGKIGSVLSGKVIEVIGSKMKKDIWVETMEMINNI
ncbi:MAG: adenosine kinase [Bacteroidales bacterium]|nr:adenosine kinase [Bacteroidales bacterium]